MIKEDKGESMNEWAVKWQKCDNPIKSKLLSNLVSEMKCKCLSSFISFLLYRNYFEMANGSGQSEQRPFQQRQNQ